MADDPYLSLGTVGNCRVVSKLGEGGMGTVYKGFHLDLELDVAIKFLHPSRVQSAGGTERFFREARLAARLNHPGIVRVFGCGEVSGYHYIVMEYVDGQSLADHIEERKALPIARALQIAEETARALGSAFDRFDVIHRDVKPANILLSSSGEVKLADLGLAKVLEDHDATVVHTSAGTALGTPSYMPPEQFLDASHVDHRADIYALGASLFHMLAGSLPFSATSLIALIRQIEHEAPEALPTSVPVEVEELVLKMMAKRPEDRFQTYKALIEALANAQKRLGDPSFSADQTLEAAPDPSKSRISTNTTIPDLKIAGRTIRAASPTENRVLLIVDVQNDFCPGGALAVPEGDQVVPVINKLARRFAHVILTQDWHCDDHLSFASSHPGMKVMSTTELPYGTQILWPDHCVQGSPGAEFHPALDVPRSEMVIRKGFHRDLDSYSAFFENDRQTPTGLAGYLRERGLTRLFLVGLATDFCVAYTALDARRLGFEVTVIEAGCRGIDVDGSLAAAWEQMEEVGVIRA